MTEPAKVDGPEGNFGDFSISLCGIVGPFHCADRKAMEHDVLWMNEALAPLVSKAAAYDRLFSIAETMQSLLCNCELISPFATKEENRQYIETAISDFSAFKAQAETK